MSAPGSVRSAFEACSAASGIPFEWPMRGKFTKCPFHQDKHPSLSVDDDKGVFHCWAGSCSQHGGVMDVPIAFGIAKDRTEASRWLSERGIIARSQGDGKRREVKRPDATYTNPKRLPQELRILRYFAIEDLRAEIGEVRTRAVRDHIATLRFRRDQADGDGSELIMLACYYSAYLELGDGATDEQIGARARERYKELRAA